MTPRFAFAVAFFLAFPSFVPAGESPKFHQVEAKLYHPRGGLHNFFTKLERGGDVRVAYLGGSITAQPGWRLKSLAWLKQQFPKANVIEINAAIGGTGSDLGVYRLEHDVLRHKPDLVLVEFAVNDGFSAPENIWRGMEGIIRQTWTADPTIDICYVYTFRDGFEKDLEVGLCPRGASADEILAEHYDIPSINVALRIAELHKVKKLIIASNEENPQVAKDVTLFSKDGVHPLDAGHERYQEVIAEAFTSFRKDRRAADHAAKLKMPFIADHWQAARLLPIQPSMLSSGWKELVGEHPYSQRVGNRVDSLWEAVTPGESIRFRFRGTSVKLYDIMGPDGGQVTVTVDGKTRGPYARFDKFCTYHRLATLTVAAGLSDDIHEAKIVIHPDQPKRNIVTDIEMTKPGFDPKKYDGTTLRVGGILILGELLPLTE